MFEKQLYIQARASHVDLWFILAKPQRADRNSILAK